MRLILFLTAILLPLLGRAQFNTFEAGSYILSTGPQLPHSSRLKLQGAYQLIAKDADGKKTSFIPAQISSFRIGAKKYVAVGGFYARLGNGENTVSRGFAEQLDSGQVVLMRFEYVISGPMMMNSGSMMSGGNSFPHVLYLLRRSTETQVTSLPASWLTGGGEKFREALLPYLSSRPDLTQLVNEKRVTVDNLATIVRAFNTNQPFAAEPAGTK